MAECGLGEPNGLLVAAKICDARRALGEVGFVARTIVRGQITVTIVDKKYIELAACHHRNSCLHRSARRNLVVCSPVRPCTVALMPGLHARVTLKNHAIGRFMTKRRQSSANTLRFLLFV